MPRSGLVFRKREGKFVLTDQMPWNSSLPMSAEELGLYQDEDYELIKDEFGKIGVEVKRA